MNRQILRRVLNRLLRGLVAVVVPVVLASLANWLVGLPGSLPPAYAGLLSPLFLAWGKWLRELGVKNVPV